MKAGVETERPQKVQSPAGLPGPVVDFRWMLFKTRLAWVAWGMQGSWTWSPAENSLHGGWPSGLTTRDNSMALGSW